MTLNEAFDEVIEELKPSWIPVSEKLPEKQGLYLVTIKSEDRYFVDTDLYNTLYKNGFRTPDVVAWMPLPEPCRAESKTKETTREEVINELNYLKEYYNSKDVNVYQGFDDEDNEALDMAIKALEQEQKWIPVSEKMPGHYEVVLVCCNDDFVTLASFSCKENRWECLTNMSSDTHFPENEEVIAWMPLPEQYKAESVSKKEKLKAEVNGYFYSLNAAGKIDWLTYNTLYNVCMFILEKYYDRMEKERRAESEEKRMKKVFISQPMNGLSDLQILEERRRAVEKLYDMGYEPKEITIIDSFIKDTAPDNVNSALWCLGKSLELLADADIAVFSKGWKNTRGCLIEFNCAKKYGISYICED